MTLNIIRTLRCTLRMSSSYYAVAVGRTPGIYHNWSECQERIHRFPGAKFKKFSTKSEAEDFIKKYQHSSNNEEQGSSEISSIFSKNVLSSNKQSTRKTNKKSHDQMVAEENESSICTLPKSKRRKTDQCENESVENTLSINAKYNTDADGYVNVFTDGACSSNGRFGAKAGIGIWFGDDHPLNVSRPVKGRATNNMAEIQAVTIAAEQAKKAGIKKLKINTDSKFLISCITKWMPKWKKNGWKTAGNKSVINKTELVEMEKALGCLEVAWNHVNGHVGIYGNEMADKLAREGCKNYRNSIKK